MHKRIRGNLIKFDRTGKNVKGELAPIAADGRRVDIEGAFNGRIEWTKQKFDSLDLRNLA